MTAPTPDSLATAPSDGLARRLMHRRAIDVQVYARADGHFDVEARLSDVKTRDVPIADGWRAAGEPIHDMVLTLVVDRELTIQAASAAMQAMPYVGRCDALGDTYGRLVGLNLFKGFRAAVLERFAGVQGCTHLTELSLVLPTAVMQAFAGEVFDTREGATEHTPPFQLDRCHALRREGAVVREHYARWWRPLATATQAPSDALAADAGPSSATP